MTSRLPKLACACVLALGCSASLADPETASAVRAGERSYVQCTGCHAPSYHRTGPLHCSLLGRQAGTVADFPFTEALRNSMLVWDEDTLDAFLRSPLTVVPGTSMAFAGIASAEERRQLIAFLATLTAENPACK